MSWREVLKAALHAGLRIDEFWETTPIELDILLEVHSEKEERKIQVQYEIARWQTAILLSPHSKKAISPKDICKFPWEQKMKKPEGGKLDKVWERMNQAMK